MNDQQVYRLSPLKLARMAASLDETTTLSELYRWATGAPPYGRIQRVSVQAGELVIVVVTGRARGHLPKSSSC